LKLGQRLISVKQPNGLLDNQADGDDVCYTYDQAVAICAFLALGDTDGARTVLVT
jgi:hypothetical protein